MYEQGQYSFEISAATVTLTTSADKYTFTPPCPVDVYGWGFIVTTSINCDGTGMVFKGDKRPTAASDTSRTDGTVGTLTLAANDDTNVAGKNLYTSFAPVQINPGEQLVIEATTAPVTGGAAFIYVKFRRRSEVVGAGEGGTNRMANAVAKTA